MAAPLRRLGLVGAVLIVVGIAMVGIGFVNDALASSAETNCEYNPPATGCVSVDDNALNASTTTISLLGIGVIAGGVGAGLVLVAAVGLMSRWPPTPPPGYPPSVPPPPFPPPGAP